MEGQDTESEAEGGNRTWGFSSTVLWNLGFMGVARFSQAVIHPFLLQRIASYTPSSWPGSFSLLRRIQQ